MVLAATLVATSFVVGKIITPFLDPAVLTLIRFFLASAFFIPYVGLRYGIRLPDWQALGRYSLISGALVGFFWMMFLSLRITTPLNTSVIFTTVPGISGCYSWFLLRERLGRHRLFALLFAMTGAIWVLCEGDVHKLQALSFNQGDVYFFIACLLMAFYTPLVKLLHRGEPMAVMTLWIMITGCVWLLLFNIPKLPTISWHTVPLVVWLGIGYLALFTTIITFFISQWATLEIGPTRVMAYSYLYPPIIVLIEWALYQTYPDTQTLLGIVIILFAMIIVQKNKSIHLQRVN
jgi:drug/metabolite transporter (DMT)-like permease